MDPQFSVSALTENDIGSFLRVAACFGRHRVVIESFSCTNGEESGVYRHSLVVRATPDRIRRAIKQIGASVGVLAASYRPVEDTVDREVALFKLSVDGAAIGNSLARIVRTSRARILIMGEGYVVLEKTGTADEIEELSENLQHFGVMEFERSGKVSVTKPRPEFAK